MSDLLIKQEASKSVVRRVPKRSGNGFTLIELLVVIAIIALLMGILLPSLNMVRRQAKKIACISNMRQMGIALQTYLLDSENRLPPSSCHLSDPNQYWLRILTKYSREKLLFRCPCDRVKDFLDWDVPIDEQPDDSRWSSFALNGLLDPHCPYDRGRYNNMLNIRRPMYCIYVSESPSSWTKYDHIHPETWGSLDGHAENLRIEQTWSWPGHCYWYPGYAPGWPPD